MDNIRPAPDHEELVLAMCEACRPETSWMLQMVAEAEVAKGMPYLQRVSFWSWGYPNKVPSNLSFNFNGRYLKEQVELSRRILEELVAEEKCIDMFFEWLARGKR